MKKILLSFSLLVSLLSVCSAQTQANDGRDAAQVVQLMKSKLKDEFTLTVVQADSILSIQQDCQLRTKGIFNNTSLSAQEKKVSVKNLRQQAKIRMSNIVAQGQLDKVDNYYLVTMDVLREQYKAGIIH